MLEKTINNITSIWNNFKSILGNIPGYNKAVVTDISKKRVIVIRDKSYQINTNDVITITDGNKSINVTGNMEIKVDGDITLQATNITFKTTDGELFKPNTIPNCLFAGSPHSICQSIKGENK